ncbi:anaerobic ribonucleoside-triphosphate reductase activating protein [Ectothiorhodospira shaposhnikovii]|uniref:anaerobic ribonucleoside-triphosphate reductase activating protein n=1 Tax=Ectothiorhodospira shaposhnikovii TaxID=1054 RepID=UPI0030B846DA
MGGLTPMTSIDYPGELAAVVFLQGCPWRCSYCQNAHLLSARPDGEMTWRQTLDFLTSRKGLLDAVVFSGGEPTLQAGLPDAIGAVKALGLKVGLHTAGIYPKRLAGVLPLIDWLGLDIKTLPEHYEAITGIPGSGEAAWESLELAIDSGVCLQVRTTVAPPVEPYIEALTLKLKQAGVSDHRLQQYRPPAMPIKP